MEDQNNPQTGTQPAPDAEAYHGVVDELEGKLKEWGDEIHEEFSEMIGKLRGFVKKA